MELSSSIISKMRPFGQSLQHNLENARLILILHSILFTTVGYGREAGLDRYFDDITVEKVRSEEGGWNMINEKPQLWSEK